MTILKLFTLVLILNLIYLSNAICQWSSISSMPTYNKGQSAVFYNGKIYSFGGFDTDPINSAYSYDLTTSKWTKLNDMPTAKYGSYAIVVNNKILIAGGTESKDLFSDITYEYNPTTNSYSEKASIPNSTYFGSVANVDNRMVIIGGINSNSQVSSIVQIYNPTTNEWIEANGTLNVAYAYQSSTVLNNIIYLIGGTPDGTITSGNCYKGILKGNDIKFEEIGTIQGGIVSASAGVSGGKVYVTGGLPYPEGGFSKTYYYNDKENKWISTFSLPTNSSEAPPLIGDGNNLYFLGGSGNLNLFKFTPNPNPASVIKVEKNEVLLNLKQNEKSIIKIPIRNIGNSNLTGTFSIPSDDDWATSDLSSFLIKPDSIKEATINIDASNLKPGVYQTEIGVVSNDKLNLNSVINVYLFVLPKDVLTQKSNIVVEEITGDWCGWCPYGHEILSTLKDKFKENLISIAYHGPYNKDPSKGEPMSNTEVGKMITALNGNSYPTAAIQRKLFKNETSRMTSRENWEKYINNVKDEFPNAPITIELLEFKFDETTKLIKSKIRLTSTQALFNSSITSTNALTIVVVEDSIKSNQTKYHSDGSPTEYIDNYVNNSVARQVYPSATGKAIQLSGGTVIAGGKLSSPGASTIVDIEFKLSTKVEDVNNSRIIFIAHKNEKGSVSDILQGSEIKLKSSILGSVKDVEKQYKLAISSTPNPSKGIVEFTFYLPKFGLAKLEIFSTNGEKISTIFNSTFENGVHKVVSDLSNLSSGNYTSVLTIGNEKVIENITVVK